MEQLNSGEKRQRSLCRAKELRYQIEGYLQVSQQIPTGYSCREQAQRTKSMILQALGANESDWHDWKWQMANRMKHPELLASFIRLPKEKIGEIQQLGQTLRWAVSPYYVSLMDPDDDSCPIRLQAIPSHQEVSVPGGLTDPMHEELSSPAPCITRRYPDRLIINVTNRCAVFCRHCQRRRGFGGRDREKDMDELVMALDYIRQNTEIRDVLITGGDALLLSDKKIDWLLTELDSISHVEIKRIGSRTPVTLPFRITPELCRVLEKHPPIYLNTQFNHPKEITPDAADACSRLIKAGVVLGNQAVLLKGINNSPHVMKKLNHELLKIRVRPYYIFQAKNVSGTLHFVTSIGEGIDIMKNLRGFTSGLAVPAYVINAPKGLGKVPVLPEYMTYAGNGKVILRTWEDKEIIYPD